MLIQTALTSLLWAVSLAAPTVLEERADTYCGSNTYSSSAVKSAANTAKQRVQADSQVSGYPHVFNNYEGFSFGIGRPFYEFPILTSGIYKGGTY